MKLKYAKINILYYWENSKSITLGHYILDFMNVFEKLLYLVLYLQRNSKLVDLVKALKATLWKLYATY
jgi:hypothetical protein